MKETLKQKIERQILVRRQEIISLEISLQRAKSIDDFTSCLVLANEIKIKNEFINTLSDLVD